MTKTNNKVILTMLMLLVCISAIFGIAFTSENNVAFAYTSPKYTLLGKVDYVANLPYGAGYTGSTDYTTNSYLADYFAVKLYSDSYSGTSSLSQNSLLPFRYVKIVAEMYKNTSPHNSNYYLSHYSYSLKNNSTGSMVSSGSLSGTGTRTLYANNLSDGYYTLTYVANASRIGTITDTFTYSFYVDATPPSYTLKAGGSSISSGSYTKSQVVYTASDTRFSRIYYKKPSQSNYSSTTDRSYTISAVPNNNGLWYFYSIDTAGNKSATVSVYLDTTKPTGHIKSKNTIIRSGGYANSSFVYSSTDSGGIAYMQYKTPLSNSWNSYSGSTIPSTSTNGWYYFRTCDKAGNVSDEYSVYLDTSKPTGKLYGGANIVSNGSTTNAGYIKFVGSDSSSGIKNLYVKTPKATSYTKYTSGSQYAVDGTYSFYCEDNSGNVSETYTITLDKTPPVLSCKETPFYSTYERGFTVSASDNISGTKIYYKGPEMTDYKLMGTNSVSISDSNKNGKYYIYAVDSIGNRSSIVWIELKVEFPKVTIITSPNDSSVFATWDGNDSTATLNGKPYTKDTWVNTEGTYTLIVTNKFGRSTTKTFSVGHYYILKETVKPTCTSQGYEVYECTHCNDIQKRNFIQASGHSYDKKVTAPTCTEKGFTVYKCKNCSHTYTADYTDALGHNYVETVIASTCTEEGCTRHTCTRCKDSYDTDKTIALGHKYVESEVSPTCTEDGCIRHTCAVCGFKYDTDIIKASGHSYHTEVTKIPTCEEAGERCHICDKCGDMTVNEIPATGHNYEITEVVTEDGKTTRHYTCTHCGHSYDQAMGEQYEKISNYVEHLFELYSPYMWWVLLGTSGVWSIAIGIAIIVAQKNEDKQKAKKMLVNYVIGLVVIAIIVVACPYLITGIASLVT